MKIQKYSKNYILLLLSGFLFSFLAVLTEFATRLNIDGFNQIVWRSFFAFICAGIAAFLFFKQSLLISKKEFKYVAINGLLFAGGVSTFTLGIYFGSPIAKAVALNFAYPLVVIGASYVLFKEKPSYKGLLATIISLTSVALLLEIWKIHDLLSLNVGDLLELLNSFFFGLMIVWGKKMNIDTKLHPFKSLFYSYMITTPLLFLLSIFISKGLNIQSIGASLYVLNIQQYLILFLLALAMIVPLALVYKASLNVKAQIIGVFLLTEPVWVYIFGLLLFDQSLSFFGILGIIGIVISILLL